MATTFPIGFSLAEVLHPTQTARHPVSRTVCSADTRKFNIIIASPLLHDVVGAHHVVGLVLLEMAVPEIASGISLKRNVDPRDHIGRTLHHILPAPLIRIGRKRRAGKAKRSFLHEVKVTIEGPAIHHLEAHMMEMNGVRIVGKIHQGPDLR